MCLYIEVVSPNAFPFTYIIKRVYRSSEPLIHPMYTTTPFWFGTVTSATVLAKTIAIASTSSTYVRASFRLPLYFAAPSFFPFSELRAGWIRTRDISSRSRRRPQLWTGFQLSGKKKFRSDGVGGRRAGETGVSQCMCAQTDERPHRLPESRQNTFCECEREEGNRTEAGNPKKKFRAFFLVVFLFLFNQHSSESVVPTRVCLAHGAGGRRGCMR